MDMFIKKYVKYWINGDLWKSPRQFDGIMAIGKNHERNFMVFSV